jgi:tRNA (adenine37-N6)-methyltransferase
MPPSFPLYSIFFTATSLTLSLYLFKKLKKEQENRKAERSGRIKAEKLLKSQSDSEKVSDCSVVIHPIGTVKSVYSKRFGTPRQPALVPSATAQIHIRPELKQALNGLIEFSHFYVIYNFHENVTAANKGDRPFDKVNCLVNVPRIEGLKRGIYATRSPHRPNSLGLSLVKLLKVDGLVLTVEGLDAIDGTPVIDIKPYLVDVECVSNAVVPGWVKESYEREGLLVIWRSPRALPGKSKGLIPNWMTEEQVLRVVEETLAVGDLRSAHQKDSEWQGKLEIAGLKVSYVIGNDPNKNTVDIVAVEI